MVPAPGMAPAPGMPAPPATPAAIPFAVITAPGFAASACRNSASSGVNAAPDSARFSRFLIRCRIASRLVFISGLQSLIRVVSTRTRRCVTWRSVPESSERTRIYRISAAGSTISLSSRSCARFSVETSSTSSRSESLCSSMRFLIYQVKSLTNCPISLPCCTSSSRIRMLPAASRAMIIRSSRLNTSVSMVPSTFRTRSNVSFSPRWNAMH